jgi:hypothetical protein
MIRDHRVHLHVQPHKPDKKDAPRTNPFLSGFVNVCIPQPNHTTEADKTRTRFALGNFYRHIKW